MIDLLSVASGSTYQHSSPRPLCFSAPCPATSLFTFSFCSPSFLTMTAHLSVEMCEWMTLNHIGAIDNEFLQFSDSEQWKSARREGKKRPPWRPNVHRPDSDYREPPRSWSPPTIHVHADFSMPAIVLDLGSQQHRLSLTELQFPSWPLEWELVSGTTRGASPSIP